ISPKIWAWKEYRIKNIKRDVDELFSILPFEVDFFEKKHHYPIHYVGNPTADEVREWRLSPLNSQFSILNSPKIIALLAGSRKQEIKDNLPAMLEAVKDYQEDYKIVLAGAPGIEPAYYDLFLQGTGVEVVFNQTYPLLAQAHAALVTSGTATLETALFRVPQVVCYETPLPRLIGWLRKKVLSVKYISLVNLVAGREVVTELVADTFSVANIRSELQKILEGPARQQMLDGYEEVARALGDQKAPDNAANIMYTLLNNSKS
ncbi:MAG: lipid-A-disaccharide synthase, partial [Prevotella sp.]|nr:lipid-A-disaccharide synthase [Prevotella sp.]